MERPQLLGTDAGTIERCRECRGQVMRVGEEFACTSCGVVARREEQAAEDLSGGRTIAIRRLGSYMGTREDQESFADFNGNSTVGYAKRISDNMGLDRAAWNCSEMTRTVADKLSLPSFVRETALALSE